MPGDSRAYLTPSGDGAAHAWADEAAREGRRGTQQLLEVDTVAAPSEVAQQLDLAFGNQVVRRKRLILMDDEPVEIATSYFPATIAADSDLALDKKVKGGAPAVLTALGYAPTRAREVVETRRPTWDEEKLLRLRDTWVLTLTRTVFSTDETPIELALNVMVPSRSLGYVVDV